MKLQYWRNYPEDNEPSEEDIAAEQAYMREHVDSREGFSQSEQEAYDWEFDEWCDCMDGDEYDEW